MGNSFKYWSVITSGNFPICYEYDLFHKYSFTRNESSNFRLMVLKILVLICGLLRYDCYEVKTVSVLD